MFTRPHHVDDVITSVGGAKLAHNHPIQRLTESLVEWILNGCSGPHTEMERRFGPALLVSIQNLLSFPTTSYRSFEAVHVSQAGVH